MLQVATGLDNNDKESVTDYQSDMIILESLLITSEASIIFWGLLGQQ